MREKHRIAEMRLANIETDFGKLVGPNARRENYGYNQREWLLQVTTDSGLTGVTNARPAMSAGSVLDLTTVLTELLGRDVFEFYRVQGGRVTGVHPRWQALLKANGFLDFALFDLMGRALDVPAHDLLGDRVRDRVDAYDSTLYFQDMVHPAEGAGAVAREAREGVDRGLRAVKLKLGRCGRWFEPAAGMARDIEVVQRTREAVGPDVRILVDANNGYDGKMGLLETFVRETGDADLFWMEKVYLQVGPVQQESTGINRNQHSYSLGTAYGVRQSSTWVPVSLTSLWRRRESSTQVGQNQQKGEANEAKEIGRTG